MKKIFITGVAALGLAATPVMADVIAPATQPVTDASNFGKNDTLIAGALLAGILAVLVITVFDGDGDDDPISA